MWSRVVRRPSVRRPSVRPSLTLHIFNFFSETAEQNSTKLDRKQDLNVLYQVCGVFFGQSEKQDGRPGLWLAETFSTSSLKPLNGIQRNLTGNKISTSSTKFVFFGPIGKTRWPPWPLIGWDIFDFFSETAERNSTKLDRKQDLNVLYQVCVFRADRKNKMAALASNWLRHFRLLLWNRWTEFNETWQEARSQCLLLRFPSTVFWEKNGNGWVHNIESVTKLLKCNVFAQVIYQKIGNFLYFSIFLNMHPKFLIILEILTTKMAQKRAQKVQKIAKPRGFRSRILHCSA